MKLGRFDEARAEFERAASLTQNVRKRQLLLEQAAVSMSRIGSPACAGSSELHTRNEVPADVSPDAGTDEGSARSRAQQ